jgi:predicted metal-dependent phosphoesterase TrpH
LTSKGVNPEIWGRERGPEMPRLKIDLHVHTEYSDSKGRLDDVVRTALRKGLDGIAITDHNTCKAALLALDRYSDRIIIIPGLEYGTEEGHLIALGIVDVPPWGLSASQAARYFHERGAIVIIPHPKIPLLGFREEALKGVKPDAIETCNSATPFYGLATKRSERLADSLKLPRIGGSDAHDGECVGDSYTIVDSSSREMVDILQAIRDGRTTPQGHPSSLFYRLRLMFNLYV